MDSKKIKLEIIREAEAAVNELVKVAKEDIIKKNMDDLSPELAADRLKNAAATKKLAIFDAFEILSRIESEKAMLEDSEEKNIKKEEKYDSSQIQKLEGLEGVRKRPDMYIGDTNERGLHHCVFEIVDNSIDESLAGYCSEIKVHLHADGSCSIQDNGRGIPVDVHPKHNMPALELVLTNLHAGGKFGKGAYQVSGGLHGVGAKCVNAVSEWFVAEVRREEKIHQMEFSRGITTQKMKVIGSCQSTGTKVTFLPDEQIFTETREFKFDVLAKRLRELAFLNPGVKISLKEDKRSEERV